MATTEYFGVIRLVAHAAGLFLMAWHLGACGWSEREPPSVLLLTLDATRVDALGLYGGPRANTPHLDELAKESAFFTQAITTATYTGPSHASILTGLFPPQHGLRDFLNQALPDSAQTLAEVLKEAGYATAAFVSAYVLEPRYGLNQGFDVYSSKLWSPEPEPAKKRRGLFFQRRASNTVAEALHWFETRNADRPFFAWLHFYDPHAPYDPPPEYRSSEAGERNPDDIASKRRRYYDEVTYMDAEIGRLLEALDKMGLYEDLVVLVVADHGELLGEHGRRLGTHSPMLVDATVRVPLLVRVPERLRPGRVTQQVRIVDLFPTVLEATGLPVPSGVEGRSLLGLHPSEPARPAYTETFYEFYPERASEGNELISVRLDGWKLIARPGREELFDLQADPEELRDVSADEPERVSLLRATLRDLAARWPEDLTSQQLELSEGETQDHLERLRGLGYVE